MALVDRDAGIVVTAAPGTASTALREAMLAQRQVSELPDPAAARAAGLDTKHATVHQLVEAGLLDTGHGWRILTTTRNPFDFYVAEYERSRTRWVHELRRPDSWVHVTPGAVDRIVDALTLDFDAWLARALGVKGVEAVEGAEAAEREVPRPRRINAGHVEEADVVLRMEHLEADLRMLVGLELRVPATNVTDRERAWWRSYSVASRRLVEQAHHDDLERFGYRF